MVLWTKMWSKTLQKKKKWEEVVNFTEPGNF